MSIFLTFLPWIVRGVLSPFSLPLALGIALLLSFVLLCRSRHVMEWVAFIFFFIAFPCSLFIEGVQAQSIISLASSLILILIAWGSLYLNKPFTLPYAKKQTPEAYWCSIPFFKINQIITAFFGVVFGLELAFKVLGQFYPESFYLKIFEIAVRFVPLVFVPRFPRWYTKRFLGEVTV